MTATSQHATTATEPPAREVRRPSTAAHEALEWFAQLSAFFATDAALARALEWDEQTVADWRTERVTRPRKRKREDVRRLLELCDEANVYLRHSQQAGVWVLAPTPQLQGDSPAAFLRAGGDEALRTLNRHAFKTMPRSDTWVDDDGWEDIPLPSDG